MRSIVASLAALMSASLFVQFSNSAMSTLIPLRLAAAGQSESDVGIIAAAFSAGFALGCFAAPKPILRVGFIRGFAAAAAVCTVAAIMLDLTGNVDKNVIVWSLLRFTMGAAIAATFAISDAWINERSPNEIRGRVIAIYSILISIASIASQLVFFLVDVAFDGFYSALAIMFNISVVIICMMNAPVPRVESSSSGGMLKLKIISATGLAAAFTSGFIAMSIITIIPFYLAAKGVTSELIALSVIFIFVGRLIFQWPIGWLSDRFDRRAVLVALAVAITALFLALLVIGPTEGKAISGMLGLPYLYLTFGILLLLGGFSFPIYSVGLSLAFDRSKGRSKMHVATTMLFFNSVGSVAGPLTVAGGVIFFGDNSLSASAMVVSIALLIFTIVRMLMVPAPINQVTAISDPPVSSFALSEAIEQVAAKAET